MGKVQKKANDRHKVNLSPALTEFISKTTSFPLIQLPQHLSSFPFRWPFPRGDLYNWIDTLDRFDEILHSFCKAYALDVGPQTEVIGTTILAESSDDTSVDVATLKEHGLPADGDRILVESILAFSRLLLEKCGNRTLYNSTERLNDLLNTTSLPLLHETLRLTHVLAQRFADRGPQSPGHAQFYHFDLDKLQKLAAQVPRQTQRRGPLSPLKTPKSKDKSSQPKLRRAPTTADPNDLRALAKPTTPVSEDAVAKALDWSSVASVRVVWTPKEFSSSTTQRPALGSRASYQNAPSSPTPVRQQQTPSRNGPVPPIDTTTPQTPLADSSGLRYIELDALELESTTPEQVLLKEMSDMPSASAYELLHKLRLAYGLLDSDESRLLLVYIRLTALGVVGQVYSEEELTAKYFDGDANASARQQLVQLLVDLLREPKDGRRIPLYLQSLAMETLAIMSRYRQMMSEILSALTPNSSHGLLMSLVQKGILDIATDGDGTDNEEGDLWRHAVFMMWMVFMNPSVPHTTRSTEQFMHKNLITAYASGLQVLTQKSLRIHVCIVKFLEHLFHHFKDGLQVLNANGAFSLICDLTDKLSNQALELCKSGQGTPDEWKTKGMDYRIPYMQQYVLREVIGLIKDVSKHQGNHADRALRGFVDSRNLLNAFRLVLSHIDEFGAHTWSEIVTAVCAFLNNEPTSYTVVSEAGIITTLLSTIQPEEGPRSAENGPRTISAKPSGTALRLPPSADAIVNLASSFSAICLTEAGNRRFVESGVLPKFFELFESPEHVKAVKDTSILVQLGPTFDELVRHHPMLRDLVVSSIATMIARVRYICKTEFRTIGAGPKMWLKDASGLYVDGGAEALTAEGLPFGGTDSLDFAPLKLPNDDTLESGVTPFNADPALLRNARDEDKDGLTAADYARPAIAFLASFLETQFLCKELLSTGVADLILDFVTLPTIPISDDAFGEGIMLQDLTTVVRQVAEEKPHLTLPLLVDRARYTCSTALAEFTQFSPDQIRCYFDRYLQTKDVDSTMDVDTASSAISGTRAVKGLMNVYSIVRVLTEVFTVSGYPRPAHHNSVLANVNISDLVSELMSHLGKLSAACCREEISLLATMPRSWLDATRPGSYSTGDPAIDTILDVSNDHERDPAENETLPKLIAELEDVPSFRNLRTLRYLVSETPAIIATLFSRIGSSFGGRKKPDTFLKQKLHSVADAIARAFTVQLKPAFLSLGFPNEDPDRVKDWKFKYFAVVLSRLKDSLWDDNSNMPSTSSLHQSYIVDCFRRADGMKALDAIGTEFYEELKLCQVDKPVVFAANAGLKLCLSLFVDLTREDITQSQQTNYLKNLDKERPFYFNPNQLILELRMESLPLTRRIWDSEYAEQASGDVVKQLTYILKHVLKGDSEDNIFPRMEDFPQMKPFEKREYSVDQAKVNLLKEKGFDQDLAEEAMFRCNVGQSIGQMANAEEYCRAQRDNPYRRLLPAPPGDTKYKGSNIATPAQVTSPPTAMEITSGPMMHEDSSQDEDLDDALEMRHPREVPDALPPSLLTIDPNATPHSTSQNHGNEAASESFAVQTSDIRYSKQSIDAERDSIREELVERCNNVLSNHPSLIFDLNEVLCAGAAKLPEEEAKEWWETGTDLLVTSLLSQRTEDDLDKTQGQKVAATAHLIGLLCNNDTFKPSMLKVLQENLDEIVGFLKLPGPNTEGDDAYPWIAPVLLIIERMVALDAEPDTVNWTVPTDMDSYAEPEIVHNEVVKRESKIKIFNRLMEILPKVGKSKSMALAVARVLMILTRDRGLAQLQGERRNLQKLFLMVKQLSGRATGRLQASLMIVLRHVIEDDVTIKQIMGTEIVAWFKNRSSARQADLRAYLNDLNFLALRAPALFVEVTNKKVKLSSWNPGQPGASSPLVLRTSESEPTADEAPSRNETIAGETAESVEQQLESVTEKDKTQELKVPTVKHPDGVFHFLISELLSYKEVEDKDSDQHAAKEKEIDSTPASSTPEDRVQVNATTNSDKPTKPRFTADEHPIFMYRCFLLHCLTELLYSYNQTKIEFISFSRKADPLAATPSKARSGVLNYLLNSLVSSGYVDKDESIACRKRMSTSEWAMRVIVALCTKTGEKDLGVATTSRYTSHARNVEDNDTEPDLTYVRRFVLDHAVKAFKDTVASSEVIQIRYGRLLCLAELFHKLITKPSGVDGTAFSNNNSYKRIGRMMLEKNFIAVLTSAISDVDLSFPSAKKVIKFILRPLKELTSIATELSLNSPDEFPLIVDQAVTESISSASSEVSDIDEDREETPDLYRNSALGMLDPARQDGSDSEDDEDDDEQMDFDEYEDEMDYGEDMAAPVNDGEVVSDEELEDVDGEGQMEGLPGDVPMDIEFVVNHHHHHHHHHRHDDDDESESSSDDETEDDEDPEDIEIEVNEDGDIEHDGSDGQEDEDGWEDDDDDEGAEDDDEDEDDDDPMIMIEDRLENFPDPEAGQPSLPHIQDLLRTLDEADLSTPELAHDGDVILQTNNGDDPDDENQDDDEDDDQGDNEGMDYDQPFDMMLDGPDYDENEDWGFDEPPPPAYQRRRGIAARVPVRGLPGDGRIIGIHDGRDMHHHMLGTRHHRHAPPVRSAADDGLNPLLERPGMLSSLGEGLGSMTAPIGFTLQGGPGSGLPFFPPGGGQAVITMDGPLSFGGHGAILDAIMGAIQRGDQDFLQNGRISFNVAPPAGVRDGLRPPITPNMFSRPTREDAHKSVAFLPMLTVSRWQTEAEIVFGAKNLPIKIHPIQIHVYATLVPLAQQEEKERQQKQEEERKAKAERDAQAKIELERLQKEEEERLAREEAEAEERARVEAEARAAAEAEQSQPTGEDVVAEDAMEGVQSAAPPMEPAEPVEERTRTYTTIRGQQLDITGLDIDAEYLEALPEEIREEVITSQYQMRREQAQEQGNDDSAIDQEFLDALPEDIRDEIRAQEAAAQRRRDRERARREAQASGSANNPGEMEPDDFLATLEPALRRAILAEQPPEILNALNPQHAAEGRAHARSMFFHRMPVAAGGELAAARRVAAIQRDSRRQQIVQLIDKAGVATLLRLMFMQQQGSLKVNLLNILSQICGNRQTRYEVVSLLLVILKEGSTDVTAIERSLASLSLRAKATASQKTPQPLKRTLSMQPYAGLGEDVTPMMVVQQCLITLSHICRHNPHVKSLFLREVDVTSASKSKSKVKGKSKESRTTTHPVNDLIGLLDRRLIMDSAGCLQYLAALLATVTSPLAGLMKQERERIKAEKEAKAKSEKAQEEDSAEKTVDGTEADISMDDAPDSSASKQDPKVESSADPAANKDKSENAQPTEPDRRKPFEPPAIAEENLKLITGIFVAPECGQETFRATLETLQSLSHIPGTSEKFGEELKVHVRALSQSICLELEELLPAIEDAQTSTDVSGGAAAKFSASSSDQVKLLRVLQALDYLSLSKKEGEQSGEQKPKSILTVAYESLGLSPLWSKLSECLSAVEEKGDTISFANILLPLIESLMVVCKHTTLKESPVQVKEAVLTSPTVANYQDELEELFFKFSSDHRKILNDIVRQNPKLMQGHFSILVKNSKVLDFDNKRNYFSKQIHSRHHNNRHPQAPLQLNVRREQVFIDSYKALYFKTAEEMKYGKLNIRFNGEEGVDAGGVTREWFQVLARGMFDPNYALFQPVASDKTTFHPSTLSFVNPEHLLYFKFIGRVIGKALHEGRVLDCHFSRAVYKRILGKKPNLKDLESNDVDYYKSLCWILENDITDILEEDFSVIENEFGEEKTIDLIPNGRTISVTEDNKKEYVQKLVEYRLTESVKDQLDQFLGGFHDIIPAELISIFNEQELELLISGLPEIDVDDWKANTEYHNYNPSSQQIVWYWRIVKAMTNEERAKLLQFITGTSKVPLNGFKELEGVSGLTKFNIHKDPSTNRLPTSHTCFNQLDLPAYESFEIMKQNITTAISLGADYFGFA